LRTLEDVRSDSLVFFSGPRESSRFDLSRGKIVEKAGTELLRGVSGWVLKNVSYRLHDEHRVVSVNDVTNSIRHNQEPV